MKTISGKTILIIEDNAGDRLILTELLRSSYLSIKELLYASSLAEAFSILEQQQPHVILLDLSLPDSTGLDTFLALKNKKIPAPIIILSGLSDTELAMTAIQEGAQDYLVKDDIDERLLAKTIRYSIERKRNIEELRISNDRYNLVAKVTNDMVWDLDIINNQVFRNEEQFVRMLKLPAAHTNSTGEFWFSRIHPEDRVRLDKLMNEIQLNPEITVFDAEYRFLRGDDVYITLHDRGHILRDNDGKPVQFIGSTRDITAKKKAEEELRLLSMIAKETVNAVIVTDPEGNIEWVNEAFTTITGYTGDEVKGKKPGDFLQGEETDAAIVSYMAESIENRKPFNCEVINYTKDGRPYWIKIQGQPIFDKENKLINYFAIETDITERRLAEEELKKSGEKYRFLFDSNPASIIIWNLLSFSILEVNETALRNYGYKRSEFLQKSMLEIRPTEEVPYIQAFAGEALQDENFKTTRTWRHLHKDGKLMYMQISSHRILFNGQPAMISLGVNVTEKVELEHRLAEERTIKDKEITQAVITAQENEREEIGRELHDNINQLLASTRLYLGLAKSEMERIPSYLEQTDNLINTAIEEIRGLSHALIPPSMQGEEFLDALENIIQIASAGTGITIEKQMEGLNPDLLPGKMQLTIYRIIQEQFNNILKYSKANKVWFKLVQQNKTVLLSIRDNGVGCNISDKPKGVGLMNIKTRASLFNGEVKIISAPQKGFELQVCFYCD